MLAVHLLFFLSSTSFAALPACKSGVVSPAGGLWSEWVVSSSKKCSTTCGSCSDLLYTRSCLSQKAGYPCVGETSRYHPCNTATCTYPAQRTCCIPYVPMVLNGSMQCGPFPKDNVPNTSPCCPENGLWTQWTGFVRDAPKMYVRTRECASAEAGCPCVGAEMEKKTECPCPRKLVFASQCNAGGVRANTFKDLTINDDTCTGILQVEASNDAVSLGEPNAMKYCSGDVGGIPFVPALRFTFPPIENRVDCASDRPFNCEVRDKSVQHATLPVSFTCDLETQYWRYDYRGWLVTGYVQLEFP